jgi:RecT family
LRSAWIDLHIEVPAKTILALLRNIQALHLDPFNEEIGFTQYEDGQWQTFISIEGCSKLLNCHEQFNGLIFTQADTQIEGVPEWVECSIYRKDRILPITVREHYIEVKGDNPIWQKMPRRMLRHRALQQCVRLAL